ncbi:hypothetical protein SAMN05444354_1501 [Stigmatella aurantiaca]|uniref:Uncharacterized protein n=1 Tax=Stigmatella aurantiaca TaxID=41 RepID=A0A1H8G270_STIAU|nr:hypothetical protein [Stigmatella aurantiaca]SEN38113.1 hypothetical protein SAMN05444354_1501 [Stigmatella aurantiaca]
MPVMVAMRRRPCAVCSLPIEVGEVITYERAVGPRHMACSERDATRRRNLFAMPCELCGVRLQRGQGELFVAESLSTLGNWKRAWNARCVDVGACSIRIHAK